MTTLERKLTAAQLSVVRATELVSDVWPGADGPTRAKLAEAGNLMDRARAKLLKAIEAEKKGAKKP